jgi:mRNA-degrading endonuclease RelE of RelBE toxin-antitoxin system
MVKRKNMVQIWVEPDVRDDLKVLSAQEKKAMSELQKEIIESYKNSKKEKKGEKYDFKF